VGTALGCPAEQSCAILASARAVELRSTGPPNQLSPHGSFHRRTSEGARAYTELNARRNSRRSLTLSVLACSY
jgi:hypothetical protein